MENFPPNYQLFVREKQGERNWFARRRVTKRRRGGFQRGCGGGGSLVRRNANSDNEGDEKGVARTLVRASVPQISTVTEISVSPSI